LLSDYVGGGGNLIVMGVDDGNAAPVNAFIEKAGTRFTVRASVITAPSGSQILAYSEQGTIAYRSIMGRGNLTKVGITLNDLISSDAPIGAMLLSEALVLGESLNSVVAEMDSSYIEYTTGGGSYSISNLSSPVFTFIADHSVKHNQFNWAFPLSHDVAANSNGVLHLNLWSDGGASGSIGVALHQSGVVGYCGVEIPEQTWSGWKEFELPLSEFYWKEGDLVTQNSSISLCFNEDGPYQDSAIAHQYKVNGMGIVAYGNSPGYKALYGSWLSADTFKVTLGDAKTILWKESYMPTWQVIDDQGRPVDYYFAGPGMIYLKAQADAKYVTFHMPVASTRMMGFVISGISLVLMGGWSLSCAIQSRRKPNKITRYKQNLHEALQHLTFKLEFQCAGVTQR
jgi:hypothetical protein